MSQAESCFCVGRQPKWVQVPCRVLLGCLVAGVAGVAGLGWASSARAGSSYANWSGTDTPFGDWFDPMNWREGVVPNTVDFYTRIGNGHTARLYDGQVAQVRYMTVGRNDEEPGVSTGGLIIDNATLYTRSLRLNGNATLSLNNATLLTDVPVGPGSTGLSSITSAGSLIDVDIANSDLSLFTFSFGDAPSLAESSLVQIDVMGSQLSSMEFELGRYFTDATWTQADTALDVSGVLEVGDGISLSATFSLDSGSVTAGSTLLGYVHPVDAMYDGSGTINQAAGSTWSTDSLELTANGTYNLSGGALHIESDLRGEGVLDFAGTAATVTVGDLAQIDMRGLTLDNAGAASFTGGGQGVLFVDPGFDGGSIFGTFSFGGTVIETGAPIHIATGQTLTLSGDIRQDVAVDGTLLSPGGAGETYLYGTTTIRGSVDLNRGENEFGGIVVDGTTSVLEASGSANLRQLLVGDSSQDATFRQEGGTMTTGSLVIRAIDGSTAEYNMVDGLYEGSLSVVSDDAAGSLARFFHSGGVVSVGSVTLGYAPRPIGVSGLNTPDTVVGTGEYYLGAGGTLNITGTSLSRIGTFGGDGRFVLDGGVFNASVPGAQVRVGDTDGVTGTFEMNSGSLITDTLLVGRQGTGRFVHRAGHVTVLGLLELGDRQGQTEIEIDPDTGEEIITVLSGGDGRYHISGGTLTAGRISVSDAGVGIVQHDAGAVTTDLLYIGENTQTQGLARYYLEGGVLVAEELRIGRPLSQSGDSSTRGKLLQTGGVAVIGLGQIAPNGEYELFGGTLEINRGLTLNRGAIDLGDGDGAIVLNEGSFLNLADGYVLGSPNSSLSAGTDTLVVVSDLSILDQFGTFSTQGLVHVEGNQLIIPEAMTIGAAGSLSGGVVNNGGLAPGSSPGNLVIDGNYSQTAGAELVIELGADDGSADTADTDYVLVTGLAELDGRLSVLLYEDHLPTEGDIYTFMRANGGYAGTFSNVENGRVFLPGGSFAISFHANFKTANLFDFQAAVFGDLDLDGVVAASDLDIILAHWGEEVFRGEFERGDWTGDGRVNEDDLQVVLDNWGSTTPGVNVPEPGTLAVFSLSLGALTRRRRRAA